MRKVVSVKQSGTIIGVALALLPLRAMAQAPDYGKQAMALTIGDMTQQWVEWRAKALALDAENKTLKAHIADLEKTQPPAPEK